MAFDFQPYDPSKPRMVTSFKGNQKLIFEGYRYNIHHIVPAKGVKTWRCVCAKKLTSQRSWCKGRAETWDGDSQGLSKGDHNHEPEHVDAELEYFKSQLIMAAIKFPNANLNDLIDEAAALMSPGLNFGSSRESLKKSLTVARKAAENGGFKMKNYKNSGSNGTVASMVHRKKSHKSVTNKLEKASSSSDQNVEVETVDEIPLATFLDFPTHQQQPQNASSPPQNQPKKSVESQHQNQIQANDMVALFTQLANASSAGKNLQTVGNFPSPLLTSTPIPGSSGQKRRFLAKQEDDSGFVENSSPASINSSKKSAGGGPVKKRGKMNQPQQQQLLSSIKSEQCSSPSFLSSSPGFSFTQPPTASTTFPSSTFDFEGVHQNNTTNGGNMMNANALITAMLQLQNMFNGGSNNSVNLTNNGIAGTAAGATANLSQSSHQIHARNQQQQQRQQKDFASMNVDSYGNQMKFLGTMGISVNNSACKVNQPSQAFRSEKVPQASSIAEKQKKAQRVNNIFNKLSNKAAANKTLGAPNAATAETKSIDREQTLSERKLSTEDEKERKTSDATIFPAKSEHAINSSPSSPASTPIPSNTGKQFASVEIQTDPTDGPSFSPSGSSPSYKSQLLMDPGKIRLSECLRNKMVGNGPCECRIIRVCCCSDSTNCKKRGENNGCMVVNTADEDLLLLGQTERHSPSSTSSAAPFHGEDQVEGCSSSMKNSDVSVSHDDNREPENSDALQPKENPSLFVAISSS